ncbi:PREDICTED: ligand-dependent nuclear receptor corepressor-like protein isoform X2 [Branchiostoma belcheri]|uniref:Ligand-dependent nuclear receptor corepressor-like protein isoform X2 n=1 Tax=Branchiostoma belcheri TaxID=7741 RepID=A0A6P5A989_BRABE|nr:PREDICTED: ligand-dependent nuclear receptor corepressor-like protein isoform X2 [Branchiostoma belcheri]
MAGCSNARCSSERRSLRRELDHWRKDLITCVGLESFAEFLMGPERFKEVMPFNGFEAVDCPDWEPSSECRLCHARREVVTESLEHHKELIERQRTLEEAHTQDFPGSYVPFKFSSAQEAIRHLASHHASKQQQSSQSALQEDSDNLDSEEDDLPPSPMNNSCNGSGARKLRNSPYFLKIPRVPFGHQGRSKHSRQTYSPSDLSRALHDVRAGKLGTRKASNVYGVPRSTIRNYLNRKNCENLTEPKQESEKITESEGPPVKVGNRLRTLLESVSGKAQAVLEREAVLRRALNSHQESVEDKGRHKQSYANEIKLPITSSILRSLAVARMQEVQSKEKKDHHRETQVPKVPKKAIQLKIPRVAQRTGRTKAEQNENAETTSQQLKTKLRTSIVSRGGFHQMDHHPFESGLFGRNLSKPPAGNSGNSRHHHEASSRDAANSPRRKRGRYRCYTPDDLETAVSMVTMGLMSISRAQQLYRIPHSTLEYKVKERRSELKEAAERNRLFYYPAYMHGASGGSASPYPSPFFQWAWPRSQYYVQDHASNSHDVKEGSGGHDEDDCVIVEEFHPSGQASSSM